MTAETVVAHGHILPDADWAAVVRRAEEITREAAANATGGAAPIVAPIVDMRGRSAKHNGYSMATQLLVLHSAECPLMPGYAQSLTEWAITSTVMASWQRFVGPDARVYMIPDYLAAWHASEANPMSIGWEQAGYARYSREEWLTPNGLQQMDSLAYDMAGVAIERGIPARWLTTEEVTAVTTHGNRTIKGFCLHRQIDPESRTDPGGGYPYDLLMDRIRFFMGLDPAENTTTEDEEIEMAAAEILAELQQVRTRQEQTVVWADGRFNDLARQAEANRNMTAGFVRDLFLSGENVSEAELEAKLQQLTAAQPVPGSGVTLYKGKDTAEVYAWDPGAGLRHLTGDEYSALILAGATRVDLDQEAMDKFVAAVGVAA